MRLLDAIGTTLYILGMLSMVVGLITLVMGVRHYIVRPTTL